MIRKTYKVLIVDDDILIRGMYSEYLRKNGFEVETSDSAEHGLEKIIRSKPDVLLLDIMMARMNGWQMLDYIRNELGIDEYELPVIVMSAVVGSDLEMEYMRHRANDWAVKPIRPIAILLHKIRSVLGLDALERATTEGAKCN